MTFITQLTHDDEYYDDEEGKDLFLDSLLDKMRRGSQYHSKIRQDFLKPEKEISLHFLMHFFCIESILQ